MKISLTWLRFSWFISLKTTLMQPALLDNIKVGFSLLIIWPNKLEQLKFNDIVGHVTSLIFKKNDLIKQTRGPFQFLEQVKQQYLPENSSTWDSNSSMTVFAMFLSVWSVRKMDMLARSSSITRPISPGTVSLKKKRFCNNSFKESH